MKLLRKTPTLIATLLLAVTPLLSHADSVFLPLDLSTGNTSFGRNNAIGSFIDTYSFSLLGSPFLVTSTASTARSGTQDLDFASLVIQNASNIVVATFDGNLGSSSNEFYSLPEMTLPAGDYRLIVTGMNSVTQASYSGNLAVSAVAAPVPEPDTLALWAAGLAAMAFIRRRRSV
jgi:PEP-CTERM motif